MKKDSRLKTQDSRFKTRFFNPSILQFFIVLYVRFKGSDFFLKRAIKKAKKKRAEDGKRYRVFFLQNKYQVLTRSDIQRRKHDNQFGWHVNSTNMQPHCFFDTASTRLRPSSAERSATAAKIVNS